MSLKNPYKQGGMFEGASHLVFENAKNLRGNMTAAEMALWIHLRKGIHGLKFRKQHPVGLYIADFYCHKAKLIIEVDGAIHQDELIKANDEIREKDLLNWGYKTIRFTNREVLAHIETVLEKISTEVNHIINNKASQSGV
jgi:cyclase